MSLLPPSGSAVQFRFLYPGRTSKDCIHRSRPLRAIGKDCCIANHICVFPTQARYFEGPVAWVNELPHLGTTAEKAILVLPTRHTEHLLKTPDWLGAAIREVGFLATRGNPWSVGGKRWKAKPITAHGILEITGSSRNCRSWWNDPFRDVVPGIAAFRQAMDAGVVDLRI